MGRLLRTSISVIIFMAAITAFQKNTAPVFAAEGSVYSFVVSENESNFIDRLLYAAFARLGHNVRVTGEAASSGLIAANSGDFDGIGAQVAGIDESYPNLAMADEPVGEIGFYFYIRKDSIYRQRDWSGWESLSGLRVGQVYEKYHTKKQYPDSVMAIKNYSGNFSLISALANGEVDVAVIPLAMGSDIFLPADVYNASVLDIQPIYAYFHKKNRAIIPLFENELRKMKEDGTFSRLGSLKAFSDEDFKQNRFLLITSYGTDRAGSFQMSTEIKHTLSKRPENEVFTVNLNPLARPSDRRQNIDTINYIRSYYVTNNPDVIIALDDPALSFVKSNYHTFFKGIPVVFCAASDVSDKALEGFFSYFTGVADTPSVSETIELITKLFPETKNLYVVNDETAKGRATEAAVRRFEKHYESLDFVYGGGTTFSGLIDEIRLLPENTAVLLGDYFTDTAGITGENYSESFISEMIAQNTKAPFFGLRGEAVGFGQIGGKYTNASALGHSAAQMAQALANGSKLSEVPVVYDSSAYNEWIFDHLKLEEYNLENSKLIKDLDAHFVNTPLSFKEINPGAYAALIFILTLGAGFILTLFLSSVRLSSKNKRLVEAQKNLHTTEELLEKEDLLEQAKKESEKIIDIAPIMYVFTVSGTVVDCNKYSQEILGIFPGDKISEFYANPSDRIRLFEILESEAVVFGKTVEFVSAKNRAGKSEERITTRFLINMSLIEREEGVCAFLWGMDIESSERQRTALEKGQKDMQTLIDAFPMPLFIFDPVTLETLYGNDACVSLFGYDKQDDIIGRKMFTELFGDDSQVSEITDAEHSAILKNTTYKTRFDEDIDLSAICMGVDYMTAGAVIVILQDVSAEIKKAYMLESLAAKEKEANELKSKFIVNMSHEIRTPMNAIIGLSEIELKHADAIRRDTPMDKNSAERSVKDEKEYIEVFKKINASAKNLLGLVNDILDFSKMEADMLDIAEYAFTLEDILEDALIVASQRAGDKNVQVLANISQDLPCTLLGDKVRLWQILKNLLDNSAKFTNEGYITLTVKPLWDAGSGNLIIEFKVSDTGCGITEGQLEKIFDPFEQFQDLNKRHEGTGLGMPITKQLVTIMGGELSIDSTFSKGTKTTVRLPFKKAPGSVSIKLKNADKRFHGLRVLIMEQAPFSMALTKLILSESGFEVFCADSLEKAHKIIEDEEKGFDIILADAIANEAGVLAFAEELRENPSGEIPKLMVMTSFSRLISSSEAFEYNLSTLFDVFVEKPFTPSALIAKVREALLIQSEKEDSERTATFYGAKVLLVEDNEINQVVACGILEIYGITPSIANDGAEAVEMLEKEDFDLVFMDILMPVLNGHDATEKIRSSGGKYADVPIVAMTANAMKEEIDRCLAEGMNGYIIKPIDSDRLYGELLKWLSPYAVYNALEPDGGAPHEVYEIQEIPEIPVLEASLSSEMTEILDVADGISRFAGKSDRYKKSLNGFCAELPDSIAEIDAAITDSKFAEARAIAHRIKGVAGNLGAKRLYNSSADIEMFFIAEKYDEAALNTFQTDIKDFITATESFLGKPSEDSSSQSVISDGEIMELLISLKKTLEDFDPETSEKIIEKLRHGVNNYKYAERLQRVCSLVEGYNYDGAIDEINELEGLPENLADEEGIHE